LISLLKIAPIGAGNNILSVLGEAKVAELKLYKYLVEDLINMELPRV